MSRTDNGTRPSRQARSRLSGPAIGAIIGAMLWANSTQAGFSGSTDPWPGSTVRPVADDLGEAVERLLDRGISPGTAHGRGHAGRRARIEEQGTRLGMAVPALGLAQ